MQNEKGMTINVSCIYEFNVKNFVFHFSTTSFNLPICHILSLKELFNFCFHLLFFSEEKKIDYSLVVQIKSRILIACQGCRFRGNENLMCVCCVYSHRGELEMVALVPMFVIVLLYFTTFKLFQN